MNDGNWYGEQEPPHGQGPRVIPGQAWHQDGYPPPDAHPVSPPQVPLHHPASPHIPRQREPHTVGGGFGGQPPAPGTGGGPGSRLGGRPSRTRASGRRRVVRWLVFLVSVVLLGSASTFVWAESELKRDVDLGALEDRAPQGKGTNFLIVGSDSREGLSDEAKKNLHTGSGEGGRTDSMMLLHTGANGTTMTSLPRDSWVTIPSYVRPDTGKHYKPSHDKLNAAYSLGGPQLLVRTIEHNTGLRIDNYAEIGFAGFVGVVNSVGGVDMCVKKDIRDEKSGVDLTRGCHTLDGREGLAFVRQRHQEAEGDLGRTRNQQKFLSALAHKAATPNVVLNPLKAYPTMSAALDTLIVDKDMDLKHLTTLLQTMRSVAAGKGRQINVPVSNRNYQTSKGSAVQWNAAQADKLFEELQNDAPVTFREKN